MALNTIRTPLKLGGNNHNYQRSITNSLKLFLQKTQFVRFIRWYMLYTSYYMLFKNVVHDVFGVDSKVVGSLNLTKLFSHNKHTGKSLLSTPQKLNNMFETTYP